MVVVFVIVPQVCMLLRQIPIPTIVHSAIQKGEQKRKEVGEEAGRSEDMGLSRLETWSGHFSGLSRPNQRVGLDSAAFSLPAADASKALFFDGGGGGGLK